MFLESLSPPYISIPAGFPAPCSPEVSRSCLNVPYFLANGIQVLIAPLFQMELQMPRHLFRAKNVKTLNVHCCSPTPCQRISGSSQPRTRALQPQGLGNGVRVLALCATSGRAVEERPNTALPLTPFSTSLCIATFCIKKKIQIGRAHV